jgi:hypothetical protein
VTVEHHLHPVTLENWHPAADDRLGGAVLRATRVGRPVEDDHPEFRARRAQPPVEPDALPLVGVVSVQEQQLDPWQPLGVWEWR